tara:strand:- start:338 stop:700 length:363 start_codon:yes stop_codon:yes gene_type:complete
MYLSQIDAIIMQITRQRIGIDPQGSEIPELISKYVWGMTPKEIYDKTVSKIPKEIYGTFDLNVCGGGGCPNCNYHTFPCLNCAAYVYNYYLGYGRANGVKQTDKLFLMRNYFYDWALLLA